MPACLKFDDFGVEIVYLSKGDFVMLGEPVKKGTSFWYSHRKKKILSSAINIKSHADRYRNFGK